MSEADASSESIPFVIVGAARSGTTLLSATVNAHRNAVCWGEALNNVWLAEGRELWVPQPLREFFTAERQQEALAKAGRDGFEFLSYLRHFAEAHGQRVVGFKMLYAHGMHRPETVEGLAGVPNLRVVHVRRTDQLARVVSLHRAMRSGAWTAAQGSSRQTVELDFDECVQEVDRNLAMEQYVADAFAGCAMLELRYEDLDADFAAVLTRFQDHLGLAREPVTAPMRKQGGDRLRDAIANFDDLAARARGTRWEALFADR